MFVPTESRTVLCRVGARYSGGRRAGVQDGVLPTADSGQQRNWSVQEENDWLRAVGASPFAMP
jgi:hypothetical protein